MGRSTAVYGLHSILTARSQQMLRNVSHGLSTYNKYIIPHIPRLDAHCLIHQVVIVAFLFLSIFVRAQYDNIRTIIKS